MAKGTYSVEEKVKQGLSVTAIGELFRLRDLLQELNQYALVRVMLPKVTTMLAMVDKTIKERCEG